MVRPSASRSTRGPSGRWPQHGGHRRQRHLPGLHRSPHRLTTDTVEMIATLEADDDLPSLEIGADRSRCAGPLMRRSCCAVAVQVVGATTTDVDEVQAALAATAVAGIWEGEEGDAGEPSKYGRRCSRRRCSWPASPRWSAVCCRHRRRWLAADGVTAATGSLGGGTLGDGADEVRILNWQAYIDPSEDGAVGTVERFTQGTGIKVEYSEDFNDNNETYARRSSPISPTARRPTSTSCARRTGWRLG
jgi:hypothetical protein